MTIAPVNQQQTTEPFVWGKGGKRMTPEDIAREQQIAAALMQPDFSPIQHWTQGLGRVAQGAIGGIRDRRADKAAETNAAESASIAQLLLNPQASMSPAGEVPAAGGNPSGGINPAIIQALSSPYMDDTTKKLAMQQYTAATKRAEPIEIAGKLVDPTTREVLGDYSTPDVFTQMMSGAGIDPKTPEGMGLFRQRAQNLADPVVNVPLPGGSVYIGPRSGMAAAMGGMTAGAPAAGTAPPNILPPDFNEFDDGGPTQPASGGFPGR